MPNQHTDITILRTLEQNPALTQRGVAAEIGVSLGKVNYCIKKLIEKGLIKANNFRHSDNKKSYAYLLTPKGVEEKRRLTISFLQHKMEEYDRLESEIAQLPLCQDTCPLSNLSIQTKAGVGK